VDARGQQWGKRGLWGSAKGDFRLVPGEGEMQRRLDTQGGVSHRERNIPLRSVVHAIPGMNEPAGAENDREDEANDQTEQEFPHAGGWLLPIHRGRVGADELSARPGGGAWGVEYFVPDLDKRGHTGSLT